MMEGTITGFLDWDEKSQRFESLGNVIEVKNSMMLVVESEKVLAEDVAQLYSSDTPMDAAGYSLGDDAVAHPQNALPIFAHLGFLPDTSEDKISVRPFREAERGEFDKLQSQAAGFLRSTIEVYIYFEATAEGGVDEIEGFLARLCWTSDAAMTAAPETAVGFFIEGGRRLNFHVHPQALEHPPTSLGVDAKMPTSQGDVQLIWCRSPQPGHSAKVLRDSATAPIVVSPHEVATGHRLCKVGMPRKEISTVGPLIDGAVVTQEALPLLLRQTVVAVHDKNSMRSVFGKSTGTPRSGASSAAPRRYQSVV